MRNSMEIKFLAIGENERLARQVITAFLMDADPTVEELCDIKTAVSEAVTNAIIHGYKNEDGAVVLSATYDGNELEIIIRDKGVGIPDVEKAREPMFTTQPELERSGMGFTVMESFMDMVDVISEIGEGTKVIMRKTLRA
ncbi:MAG: anti-sigma F factor [Clostridia bacterium]|nr:anti-sigma F factor [Clostridia bacterium]